MVLRLILISEIKCAMLLYMICYFMRNLQTIWCIDDINFFFLFRYKEIEIWCVLKYKSMMWEGKCGYYYLQMYDHEFYPFHVYSDFGENIQALPPYSHVSALTATSSMPTGISQQIFAFQAQTCHSSCNELGFTDIYILLRIWKVFHDGDRFRIKITYI